MQRPGTTALLICLAAWSLPPPAAADTLDDILGFLADAGVVDPAVIDAKPLIECLATNGSPVDCANMYAPMAQSQIDAAQQEAMSAAEQEAQQYLPKDPAIQAAVQIVQAAYVKDWLKVLELTGVKLLGQIACKTGLSWSGPLNPFICGEWAPVILEKAEPVAHEALATLKSWPKVDIWRIVTLFGFELGCEIVPDIPLKDEVCGLLGKALAEIASLGKDLVAAVGAWLTEVNEFMTGTGGGSPMMTKDQYYARLVRPLIYRRALERLVENRLDLGMDQKDLAQCMGYGALLWGNACQGELNDRLQSESEALVRYVQGIPETYYSSDLSAKARHRSITHFASGEAHAYRQLIDGLPPSQWGTLVAGGIPIGIQVGNNTGGQAFYKGLFQDCRFRIHDSIFGSGAQSQMVFPDLSPSSLTDWTCYQAAGKRFAEGFEAEVAQVKTVLAPRLAEAGCATQSKGLAFSARCSTYPAWSACLTSSNATFGENAYCDIDRLAANQALGDELVGVLGGKRCSYLPLTKGSSGDFNPRVQCLRPWKAQTCEALLEHFRIGNALAAGRIEAKCTYLDTAEFKTHRDLAADQVNTLNTALSISSGGTGTTPCRQIWDPLSISCFGYSELPAVPSIPKCAEDPNRDGADSVCYVPDWTVKQDIAAQAEQGPVEPDADQPLQQAGQPKPAGRRSLLVASSEPLRAPDPMPDPTTFTAPQQTTTSDPDASATDCEFDLTYLAPQAPEIRTSADRLSAGDQVRILCRFVGTTRRISPSTCGDGERRAAASSRRLDGMASGVRSGIVAVDGQPIGVDSIPAGTRSHEKTVIWMFQEPGTHTVSCETDNPLRAELTGVDQYIAEAARISVGGRDPSQPLSTFDATRLRTVPAEAQAPPRVLMPGVRATESPARAEQPAPTIRSPAVETREPGP